MKWGRFFIGGHTELVRPVHLADPRLMRRIEEARRRLGATEVKPVRLSRIDAAHSQVHEIERQESSAQLR